MRFFHHFVLQLVWMPSLTSAIIGPSEKRGQTFSMAIILSIPGTNLWERSMNVRLIQGREALKEKEMVGSWRRRVKGVGSANSRWTVVRPFLPKPSINGETNEWAVLLHEKMVERDVSDKASVGRGREKGHEFMCLLGLNMVWTWNERVLLCWLIQTLALSKVRLFVPKVVSAVQRWSVNAPDVEEALNDCRIEERLHVERLEERLEVGVKTSWRGERWCV